MKIFGIPLLVLTFLLPAAAQTPATTTTAKATPPATGGNDTVVEEIVARVNNSIVTRADLHRAHDQMVDEIKQANPPNPEQVIEQKDKDQLKDLINQQLLIQKGQDLGFTADTELIKRLDEIRKQVGAKDMDDLAKVAEAQGVSYEDFKNNLKNQLISQHVIQSEVGQHIQVTPVEVKQFYEAHRADMEQPEQVRLNEILIPVATPKGPDGKDIAGAEPTPEAVTEAEAKAKDLYDKIKKGSSFDEIAKANSSGPTAANGGDLGYFKRGSLAKELEDKTFAMKAGDVAEPIRTKQGFVILKVAEHTDAGVPDIKKVEPAIQERLYYTKLEPAMNDYIKKLREDAYIYVNPGFVDTGAVASQSGPVMTDEKPKKAAKPAKKKKKHFILF
jgi:peptidyl-prolyl cis-trans isomerase SurA